MYEKSAASSNALEQGEASNPTKSSGSASKPMTLALIRQRYTAFGGAERFLARAVGALQKQGVGITLVARSWQREESGMARLLCSPPYLGRFWRDWGFARCVCHKLTASRFDLVQSHIHIPCCDLYRAGDGVHREWLIQRARARGWSSRLGSALSPYHHYVLAAEKGLYASPQLKAVICNSRMVQEEIHHHYGFPRERMHVIYSGVDLDRFHPDLSLKHREAMRQKWGVPLDAVVFLFVGSGFERKGVPILLEALKKLPESVYLVVVGKDKSTRRLKGKMAGSPLDGRVILAGPQEETPPFYGMADAFVLPTLYDPFPNVALEAMAAGLPMISSLKCGAVDLIHHGDNGLLGDALDLEKLVENMGYLMAGENRRRMGGAARETVASLSLTQMSEKLITLYQSLLAGH
ncbi:MAG: glycosyltransferase family 4 protein [Magnetococcales bacterium]|nr:glycosyltransferase family 4 protein [Magnetococcales bacterium]